MGSKNLLIVFFLGFIFVASGVLCGQLVIDLDKVWGDMRVMGDDADDWSGFAVASGDINGDGFMDIIIGAPNADPEGRYDAGEIYIIFGPSNSLTLFDLSFKSADITIYGTNAEDNLGDAVASGDINNDGYDDLIIGAQLADPGVRTHAGETYVIFGSSLSSPPYTIDLNQMSADITIYGSFENDHSGYSVASGDVNGDGYYDIFIGAPMASSPIPPPFGLTCSGIIYIVLGSEYPPKTIDLRTQLADITIFGEAAWYFCGRAVARGDVNNDGYDDVIIATHSASPYGRNSAGATYVIFGGSFSSLPYIIDLGTESADITVYGSSVGEWSGYSAASGDVNGDDYDDIIIGARYADPPGGDNAGATYVIFGGNFTSPMIIDLATQSADLTVYGDDGGDWSGYAVHSGNINGDDYADIIIGALRAITIGGPAAGETYVVFGDDFSPPLVIDFNFQGADITICGDDPSDLSGCSIASANINDDGYNDIIIGAYNADPPYRSNAGETYLIFGGAFCGAFITAHGLGGSSWIKEFDNYGNHIRSFKAFGALNSQGEVHLAVGDVDWDGHDEIAAGHGDGGKSWVKLFDVNGYLLCTFRAFGAANANGEVHLAIGNFDADPSDTEIAVAQGEGGHSWIKVFRADGTFIRAFKAFSAANAQGEVHLAAGDLENSDGIDEIVAGMGEGGSSRVKIFNYDGTLIRSFRAFEAADNPGGEVHLAVGTFDDDPSMEIALASGYNGGNLVRLFEKDGTFIREFVPFGFGGNPYGDVQITAADIDNNRIWEIICGHGEGGSSWVKVFKPDGTLIRSFKAFGAVNSQGEVHLGKSNY